MNNRVAFVDFVRGLLNINPLERWSPQQAKSHPFITQAKFTGPFVPPMNLKSSAISKSAAPGVQQQQHAEALSKQRAQSGTASTSASAERSAIRLCQFATDGRSICSSSTSACAPARTTDLQHDVHAFLHSPSAGSAASISFSGGCIWSPDPRDTAAYHGSAASRCIQPTAKPLCAGCHPRRSTASVYHGSATRRYTGRYSTRGKSS